MTIPSPRAGHTLTMRAERPKKRKTWETYIQMQIDTLNSLHDKYSISSDGTLISTRRLIARSTQGRQQIPDAALLEQQMQNEQNLAALKISGKFTSFKLGEDIDDDTSDEESGTPVDKSIADAHAGACDRAYC